MDLLKTKIYLDKINREYARMSKDPENIVRLDVDIMMAHVRELYDALLSNDETQSAPPAPPKSNATTSKSANDDLSSASGSVAVRPTVPPEKPSQAEQAPPPEDKPAPASPPPPVSVESIKSEEPLPTVKPQAPSVPVSFPAIPPEADGLFEFKEATELSEKLSNQPIPDLRNGIGLNDKLLLTRELFGDDNKAFENAIGILNGLDSMEEAKKYLLEHCVMRYRWTDKKRIETARKFIKLVRRRYS